MKTVRPSHKGVDAVLYIGQEVIGGQENCTLNRQMSPIKITNKITGDWEESIAGLKSWSLTCNGMFIKDQQAWNLLETAFQNGTKISVKLTDNFKEYTGQALITKMPINAVFNKAYTYSITLLGVGALQ